ncbi:MAG: isoprenylcysteine carboxylmethyltransferase family protein [Gammaproteobacteria bacterium]|nr:isoprenylcysteine carboxylmethyltransferase family protein [Gammaproteobacteria bacterium]MDH3375333.1 isoprenylcysteine carboxylmethyltransferase family protein [Gammaproteobacteria bacterium]MDH3409357.1 isoprenylcysteine carboxylmethyltransferase family protein [Gammaproteobacteria bacterium]
MNIDYLIEYRPPRIALTLVLLAIAFHAIIPWQLHPALTAAATLTATVGFSLMIRAWWLFKLAGTAICPSEPSTALVIHDVFSLTRNPMYVGITLMLVALAFAIGSAPFYLAAIGFGIVMNAVFCPYEEQKARAEFGAAYEAYARSVRRWL